VTIAPTSNPTTHVVVSQGVQRGLVNIEGSAVRASYELIHQRFDIQEFTRLDPQRDAILDAIEREAARLGASSIVQLAREARVIDVDCDAAVVRVDERRETAHGCTKRIASTVELTLTGRSR
jgi:hypothetical protein